MACAGSQGFLSMLPVYVDHILFPTLTEAGFISEARTSKAINFCKGNNEI